MRRSCGSLLRAMAAAVAAATILPGSAVAVTGPAVIHTPALFSDPAEYGGMIAVDIGNSDRSTMVVACISNRCNWLFPASTGPVPVYDNAYTATGDWFGLDLRHGQRRTVVIYANNGATRTQWGPTRITVD
jgi:hypothetical protein